MDMLKGSKWAFKDMYLLNDDRMVYIDYVKGFGEGFFMMCLC